MGEKTFRGGAQRCGPKGEGSEPRKMAPKGGGPKGGGPKISRFFPSPAIMFFHSSLSWGSSFHMTTREPKPYQDPGLRKHHQNSTRRPPREGRKNENCGGRRDKKSEILGGPGGGRSRAVLGKDGEGLSPLLLNFRNFHYFSIFCN